MLAKLLGGSELSGTKSARPVSPAKGPYSHRAETYEESCSPRPPWASRFEQLAARARKGKRAQTRAAEGHGPRRLETAQKPVVEGEAELGHRP